MIRQIHESVMRAATPEDILQVGPGASAEDVNTKWKARSLVVHPDKVNGRSRPTRRTRRRRK